MNDPLSELEELATGSEGIGLFLMQATKSHVARVAAAAAAAIREDRRRIEALETAIREIRRSHME